MARRPQKGIAIAFWLVPSKPQYELFKEVIRILAVELDAPQFQPHLTICVTSDTQGARGLLKQISAEPIHLRLRHVSCANEFTKTLFVRLEKNAALEKLNALVRRLTKLPRAPLRDPHVSLLYKRMPMAAKRDLASSIRLPFTEVAFDSVKAVRCISPMKTRADVESWREVARKKLR